MGWNKGKAEGNRGRRGRDSVLERYRSTVVEDKRIIVHRSHRLLKTMTVRFPESL